MRRRMIYPAQNELQSLGQLTVNVQTQTGYKPIEGAKVSIRKTGQTTNGPIEELTTDISGQTLTVDLPTPPLDYSLEPNSPQPYADYTLTIDAPGFERVAIIGTQVLPEELAIQEARMLSSLEISAKQEEVIAIAPHTLFFNYPPKIPESPVKDVEEKGFIVLPEPVVPEIVVVHDGPPNSPANNYYIRFKDYIKNVASSEIYSTWPLSSIQANIFAILSFTLNRVYTEWYRNKGKNFTITSSTAYDQKFSYGRNIYKNISNEVDALFTNYVSRPGIKQPLFTQYCDGTSVQCPTWLSQWGSKTLGDQGYSSINILRYYYGQDVYLKTATQVSGIPSSFPGYNLQVGSRGPAVRTIQEQLNAISNNFPAIPKLKVDGIYGPKTKASVKKFQEVFYLPPTGIVDYPTWYKISDVYVAVKRLA